MSPLPNSNSAADIALLREYEQAGAHRLILSPSSVSPDTYEKELEEMARKYLI